MTSKMARERFMHGVNGGKRLVIEAWHWSDDTDWASIGWRVIRICGTAGKVGDEGGECGDSVKHVELIDGIYAVL